MPWGWMDAARVKPRVTGTRETKKKEEEEEDIGGWPSGLMAENVLVGPEEEQRVLKRVILSGGEAVGMATTTATAAVARDKRSRNCLTSE
jgi:hypothetical protein